MTMRIGIAGHRFLENMETVTFVTEQCLSILQKAKSRHNVVALSAIAEGSDTIFAEAAFLLNIPLELVRPFDEYIADFSSDASKARYVHLRNAAIKEIKLPYRYRSPDAYFEAMQWVVKKSDLLIAAWDGKASRGKGGTADAVTHAMHSGHDWIHLNTLDQSISHYLKKNELYNEEMAGI